MAQAEAIRALALVCTLSPSPSPSSGELMARQILDSFAGHGVEDDLVRPVDHDVRPGVEADMGDGDAWPSIRARMLESDILVLATPTWMGQMSSVACRALERLDAELSETDDGVTIARNDSVYWNANIDKPSGYQDLEDIPEAVASMMAKATTQSAHLARLLRGQNYPPI